MPCPYDSLFGRALNTSAGPDILALFCMLLLAHYGKLVSMRKNKRQPLRELRGAACERCGYSKCQGALQFHHIDSTFKKDFSLHGEASVIEIEKHPERFLLLCANCHLEEHERLDNANRVFVDCPICSTSFHQEDSKKKQGRGKFCSKDCANESLRRADRLTLKERFLSHTTKESDCLIWQSAFANGVPTMAYRHENGAYRPMSARRISYLIHFGCFPAARNTSTSCGNRSCVNPHHIVEIDGKHTTSNYQSRKGQRCPTSKLTESQAREIIQRYAKGDVFQKDLASEFGVLQCTISNLLKGKSWPHLQPQKINGD